MDESEIKQLIQQMQSWGIVFDKGLSAQEVLHIQSEHNFQFPEDLKQFLMTAMPVWEANYGYGELYYSERFPNWRTHASFVIGKSRSYLFKGLWHTIEFGYEANEQWEYWNAAWGAKPAHVSEARVIFEKIFAAAPVMIPVFVHRFIPTTPLLAGNPIFSIAGHDIIHYGHNLTHYFHHEFAPYGQPIPAPTSEPRPISFWDDFVYGDQPPSYKVDLQKIDLTKYLDANNSDD